MLGPLGPSETIFLLVLVLVLFGARRLPELGRSLGQGMREFKRSIAGIGEDDKDEPEQPKSS